ncbi:adenylyl-sulfate kinase, partial [Xanthomonas campestris]
IPNFTGIDSPYEAPERPEIHLHADGENVEALARHVLEYLGLER